jgi:hypothetical protein
MKHFNAVTKHHILLEYRKYSHSHSFAALSVRHGVSGGGRTIQNWYSKWNGTSNSLKEGKRKGRTRIMNREQVNQYIRQPVNQAHRKNQAIHYTDLLHSLQQNTDFEVSLRTIQRMERNKKKSNKKEPLREQKKKVN